MRSFDLLPLVDLGFKLVDNGLICAFLEQLQPDTSSFHLPISEMTITLDDISQLLHVPAVGNFYDLLT